MADVVERLLPCPFCGSDAKHQERHNPMSRWRHSIDCCSSSCGMSGPVAASKREALDLWNERALSQAGAGGVLTARITDYLTGGGLFNPELADHDVVRDLLIECRAALAPSPAGKPVAQYRWRDPGGEWSAWFEGPLPDGCETETRVLYTTPPATPVQPTASVEAVARALCVEDGYDPDEPVIGGQSTAFQDFGQRWQANERSENTLGGRNYVREARAVLASLTPAPTPSGME